MERLPYIDQHVHWTDAPPEAVWTAAVAVLGRSFGGAGRVGRVLGCEPASCSGRFEGREGQTLPGFRVVEAEPGRRLILRGRHRFSRYELAVLLDPGQVRAQTSAAFPGPLGRLYRAGVIGTGAHRLVTKRLLRQVAEAAVRPDPARVRPPDDTR